MISNLKKRIRSSRDKEICPYYNTSKCVAIIYGTAGPESYMNIKKSLSEIDLQRLVDSEPFLKAQVQQRKLFPKGLHSFENLPFCYSMSILRRIRFSFRLHHW